MSEEKLRPVGRIDFLDTKGQTGESCYYYSEEDFLKTVKEENYYGVPMVRWILFGMTSSISN